METTKIEGFKRKSAETITKEKKKLKAFLMAVIPESYDKFDLEAHYDSSLSFGENKDMIAEQIKSFDDFKGASLKEQKEIIDSQMEKFRAERDAEIEEEILNYNKKNYVANKELDDFYKDVTHAITKMAQGYSHLAFIKGRGAIGKSYSIRKVLIENNVKFYEVCGDVTEAYLYRLFFEHNGEIIWFKDTVRVLRGLNSINLLKSATETEAQRLLTKSNYSKAQDDLSDRFIFKGKIIFDYNQVEGLTLKDDFEALKTRGDFVDVAFCIDDIKRIMTLICDEGWKKEVTAHLIKHYEFNGQNILNLRTQWKAFQTYQYAKAANKDWKTMLQQELKTMISPVRGNLYSLIGNKAVRTNDLKKLMLKNNMVGTMRTADTRINDWIACDELYKVSAEDKNFFVCINPIDTVTTKQKELDK